MSPPDDLRHTIHEVIECYGNQCFWCGIELTPGNRTIDHVIPRAKGGGEHMGNLRPSCVCDNALKGDMLPCEFETYQETTDYRRKYEAGYGTFRSGQLRRERKKAADAARKHWRRVMTAAARRGDPITVEMAAQAQRAAIDAANQLRKQQVGMAA